MVEPSMVSRLRSFWEPIASELKWYARWKTALDWQHPHAHWFVGAKLNIADNCTAHDPSHVALVWDDDVGERITLTYGELREKVSRFGNGLRELGVRKGDRVCIYMPIVPEQIIAMLACAFIGAVHVVVFSGFGVDALRQKIEDAGCSALITADVGYRRGKTLPLLPVARDAVKGIPVNTIILRREGTTLSKTETDYNDVLDSDPCEPAVMDSEDPLFILYTSGTTGKPKGIIHGCGGYMVGCHYTTTRVLGLGPKDVHWCTADPGWITGHSYVVYGPLLAGATIVITEGTPDYPTASAWWQRVERNKVTVLYTTPTAIRMCMKLGDDWPTSCDLRSLRLLGSVGEPLNPAAYTWYSRAIGNDRCPIVDTWWQTETGMHMITTLPGKPAKTGFAGPPLPGISAAIVDAHGKPCPPGTKGRLVITEPWPSMMIGIRGDETRYDQYWTNYPPYYSTGDYAIMDEDKYIQILGRADEVIISSGHNIGPAEVESALISYPGVAEAAVVGIPDELKGNIIKAFVVLRDGTGPSDELIAELKRHVRKSQGPVAMPAEVEFVRTLPKTRSGKILRRLLRARALGEEPGDLSTMED